MPPFPLKKLLALGAGTLLLAGASAAKTDDQVLVRVGATDITALQLEQAITSSPLALTFPTMSEQSQAAARGDMLLRLIDSEILTQAAIAEGLDRGETYRREVNNYRTGLLYQAFMDDIRANTGIPDEVQREIKRKFKGDSDAIAAARAAYVAAHYAEARQRALAEARARYHVTVHPERIQGDRQADTLVASGDGFRIRFADVVPPGREDDSPRLRERTLDRLLELLVAARAAQDAGLDIEPALDEYRRHLLARLLLEKKEAEWVPDKAAMRDYFQAHPNIGYLPERRQVGQIVLASREEAEAMRARILAGESLYALASEHSIDPAGRQSGGDMGWLPAGSGFPALEQALGGLGNDEISEVVETPKGFHVLTIRDRMPEERKTLADIKDRIHRAMVAEHMPAYLEELRKRYPVEWKMADRQTD